MIASRTALGIASVAVATQVSAAHAAGGPIPGTFDYIAHGRLCVIDRCQSVDAPGRLTVFKSGKVLIYFATPDRTGLQPDGVLLQLGRTVSLSGRGRLPSTVLGGLTPRGGSGTVDYDGQRLTLTVDITASGPLNGGFASVSSHFSNVFVLDPATGAIRSGTGQLSGTAQGQRADGQPFSGPISGSSTIEGR